MTEAELAQRIEEQLRRLDGLRTRRGQRDTTVKVLARAIADGQPIAPLLGKNGVVGEDSYYRRTKEWNSNPLFREVLDNVTALYSLYDSELREAVDAAARQKRHEERARLLSIGKEKLEEMLEQMDIFAQSPAQVASFLKTILTEERAEFGETPTTKIGVAVDWRENLPPGMTLAEVEAAMTQFAEIIATHRLKEESKAIAAAAPAALTSGDPPNDEE